MFTASGGPPVAPRAVVLQLLRLGSASHKHSDRESTSCLSPRLAKHQATTTDTRSNAHAVSHNFVSKKHRGTESYLTHRFATLSISFPSVATVGSPTFVGLQTCGHRTVASRRCRQCRPGPGHRRFRRQHPNVRQVPTCQCVAFVRLQSFLKFFERVLDRRFAYHNLASFRWPCVGLRCPVSSPAVLAHIGRPRTHRHRTMPRGNEFHTCAECACAWGIWAGIRYMPAVDREMCCESINSQYQFGVTTFVPGKLA